MTDWTDDCLITRSSEAQSFRKPHIIHLRPCPFVRSQWLLVTESEEGAATYTLYQAGYGPGVSETPLTPAEAIALAAQMAVAS